MLERVAIYPPFRLRERMRGAWQATGKHPAWQAREIWSLRRCIGRLAPREYYQFGLYDDARFSTVEKRRFIGAETANWMLHLLNGRDWWAVRRDKLVLQSLLRGHGLPVAEVRATYHRYRHVAGAESLRTETELEAFLRSPRSYPCFGKPVVGGRGLGLVRLNAYDSATDQLLTADGRRFRTADMVASVAEYRQRGYLFQAVQHPHEHVRAICGDRLATIRMNALLDRTGPKLFRAYWRIPVAPHQDDTFWRAGNLAAALDLETGQVTRAVTRARTELIEVERHPDSGAPVKGAAVPGWRDLKDLCLEAASTMPGVKIQGWDLAPCERGPVILEGDTGGSFALPQLVSGAGLLDDQLLGFLASHGFRSRGALDRIRHMMRRARRWMR